MQIEMPSKSKTDVAIKCVSKVLTPIVRWLIKSGVGYKDFSLIFKRIFYEQAIIETQVNNIKATDSALSLLAGLNRRDVTYFKENHFEFEETYKISVSSRVLTLWLQKKWAKKIKISNNPVSFETLAREISQDTHPKTVLLHLESLGLITVVGECVSLNAESFTPSQDTLKCQVLLAESLTNHINAGIVNIFQQPNTFLEQAINAENLSSESVEELRRFSTDLWKELSNNLLNKAVELSEHDNTSDTKPMRKFTFGVYQYNDD